MRGRAFILYKVDNWHTQDSRQVLGVFTSKENTILNTIRHAKSEGEVISSDDQYLLDTIAQTQSYEGEGEYSYEEITLNELIS
jgi:hypothetical protein